MFAKSGVLHKSRSQPTSAATIFLAQESGLVFLVDFLGTASHKSCIQYVINRNTMRVIN